MVGPYDMIDGNTVGIISMQIKKQGHSDRCIKSVAKGKPLFSVLPTEFISPCSIMLSMPLPTMMKQVRFAEPSDEDVCYFEKDENRRENWYTKKEYQCFMIESSATKKKIERRSELISFLEDAHQHCLSLSDSLTDIYDEEDALADMCYHKVRNLTVPNYNLQFASRHLTSFHFSPFFSRT